MENILKMKNIRKTYPGFRLDYVDFKIPKGYITGLIGPNGAGKTTLIKIIMNLISHEKGELKVFGKTYDKHEVEIKKQIGFVYEEEYFHEDLSGKKMKNVMKHFYPDWSDKKFKRYCSIFNLDCKKKIKKMSKGTKRKLALAIAFSHNAKFIILDEPTSGLDPVFRKELMINIMEIIEEEKASILFSTHITSDLEKIADYIAFINDGEFILKKEKNKLLEEYKIIKGKKESLNKRIKSNLLNYEISKFNFTGLYKGKKDKIKNINDKLVIEKPTIEDIMFYLNSKE